MKNILYIILIIIDCIATYLAWFNFSGKNLAMVLFVTGFIMGLLLMNIKINNTNNKINLYKRELEKESVQSLESSSKVKVLENKIKVLEKALENALKREDE